MYIYIYVCIYIYVYIYIYGDIWINNWLLWDSDLY